MSNMTGAHAPSSKIAFAGGGVSGGHVATIVAVFQELASRANDKKIEYLWIGSRTGREVAAARELGIEFRTVSTGKLRRYVSVQNLIDLARIPVGVVQAWWALRRFRPRVVFVSGGYASVPAAVAAHLLKIPLVIHENDVMPGLANQIIARFACTIFTGSQEAADFFTKKFPRTHVVVSGVPLRANVRGGDRERGYTHFLFKSNLPTLLVIGGAQGAHALNEIIVRTREQLESFCQIIHVSGEKEFSYLSARSQDTSRYRLVDFLRDDLRDALAIADVVLTRGSANVLNEVACYGVPSIIVPMQAYSSGHQLENARRFVTHQAAVMINEDELTDARLIDTLKKLLSDRAQLARMSEQARTLFVDGAAEKIARELLSHAQS